MVSFAGQSKLEPRPDAKFLTSIPIPFIWEFPWVRPVANIVNCVKSGIVISVFSVLNSKSPCFKKLMIFAGFHSMSMSMIGSITAFIIQHINSTHCPNVVKKLSMYVGPHDVYPTMDVKCSILTRECKNKKLVDNIFSSNFVLLSMC